MKRFENVENAENLRDDGANPRISLGTAPLGTVESERGQDNLNPAFQFASRLALGQNRLSSRPYGA